tara:strand:+ start:346 stop:486 length:141 start_codon:yes stop_codon:yes gene_type:complete
MELLIYIGIVLSVGNYFINERKKCNNQYDTTPKYVGDNFIILKEIK